MNNWEWKWASYKAVNYHKSRHQFWIVKGACHLPGIQIPESVTIIMIICRFRCCGDRSKYATMHIKYVGISIFCKIIVEVCVKLYLNSIFLIDDVCLKIICTWMYEFSRSFSIDIFVHLKLLLFFMIWLFWSFWFRDFRLVVRVVSICSGLYTRASWKIQHVSLLKKKSNSIAKNHSQWSVSRWVHAHGLTATSQRCLTQFEATTLDHRCDISINI